MLIRALVVWCLFAWVLLVVALYAQDLPFEGPALGWAFVFAFPAALAVAQGALGRKGVFEYPSAIFVVLTVWIGTMAPSFVVDSPEAHFVFGYSDAAVTLGRWLFFLWCTIVAVVCGRASDESIRLEPRVFDVVAVVTPVAASLGYLMVSGQFSNYQRADFAQLRPQGGALAVATAIGTNVVLAIPGFLLLVFARARSTRLKVLARACFVLTWVILFLLGGRSPMAFAACVCFFVARRVGFKFRSGIAVSVAVALPVLFFLIFTYRNVLQSSNTRTTSIFDFMSVAADATGTIVTQEDARDAAVTQFSDNAKARLWYGPQFFVTADLWMDNGPALRGTFLAGVIQALPSWLSSTKNRLAESYSLEPILVQSGRFPDMDLSATPWLQWLYEFGLLGIVVGAVLYGLLVRWIDLRVARTKSVYEALFWLGMLTLIIGPESTTDAIVPIARNIGAMIGSAYLIVGILNRLFPTRTELRAARQS